MNLFIAGIPHRKPDLTALEVGDTITLVPEPENEFDSHAIKVMHGSTHLGYIPANKTIDCKYIPEMYITQIQPSMKWSEVLISDCLPS